MPGAMPETADAAPTSVTPRVIISRPTEEATDKANRPTLASRRKTEPPPSLLYKEQARITTSDWEDVDDSPKRKSSRRRSSRDSEDRRTKSSFRNQPTTRAIERDFSRFFPSLSRIVEASESAISSRASTTSSENRRRRHRTSAKSSRIEEAGSSRRRPIRYRASGEQSRIESVLSNPSFLSVLSTLSSSSSRSSGSGSTITQQSYDRECGYQPSRMSGKAAQSGRNGDADIRTRSDAKSPNVFDYMDAPIADDSEDRRSPVSSSSSHYEPSDAGSSEAPATPSSRSTFPSPTISRGQNLPELKRQYVSSLGSARSDSKSPDPSIRSLRKQPSVCDAIAEEDDDSLPALSSESATIPQRRSSSRSSRSSRRGSDRLQLQEESVHQHMAYTQGHYVEPMYGQHRSSSASSAHSDRSTHAYQMAMQQYPWPPPPAPTAPLPPPQAMNGHISPMERAVASDPFDLNERALTGYEMLATELTNSDSSFKPLYRKFEYLNHRILLHLQDELSELEEQLRAMDQTIAQLDSSSSDSQKTPSSRRGEAFHGSDIHHRRTHLLGRIFMKTEQYNKAMSAFANMENESTPADREQVERYREWMSKHAPVHEVETRFLQRDSDLISPKKAQMALSSEGSTKYAALTHLPVALMLPLLLYSVIPSLAGRLVVTALVAVGVFVIVTTTNIRQLMAARDWQVGAGAYVLLMAAIAGCIPSHA